MASKKILLVDDEDDIREVAKVSLEMVGGMDVVTATNGIEALEIVKAEMPDAILLDVMMPEMDGPTTFQRLQADSATQHIPVVLLTAKVQSEDSSLYAELGVMGVIGKPFDPMSLSKQLADLLGWD